MDAHHIGNLPGLAAPKLAHHPVVDLAPLGAAAASHAGVTAPHQDEARELVSSGAGFRGQVKADTRDFQASGAGMQAMPWTTDKEVATAIAVLALAGIEARPLADDAWHLVSSASGKPAATVWGRCALCVAAAGYSAVLRDVAAMFSRKAVQS